jgi:hypothetical protein
METIILAAFAFIVGYSLGTKLTRAVLHRVFGEILSELNISQEQLQRFADKHDLKLVPVEVNEDGEEEVIVEVVIEEHNGHLYAFRKEDNKFLGQGSDREALLERLKEEFTGTVKMVVKEADGAHHIKQTS